MNAIALHIVDEVDHAPRLALDLPPETTFEDWRDLGAQLALASRKINWLIGDWLIAGLERYGEKAREEALAIFRRDERRLGPIVETCRIFPPDERRQGLSFSHHAFLAPIAAPLIKSDDAEAKAEARRIRDELLDRAEAEQWDTSEMRSQIAVVRHQSGQLFHEPDDDPEDTAMRAIVQAWNLAPKTSRQSFIELAQESHYGVIDL